MAGESKTEKATPKKRRDERKKGNVFLSKDAVVVVSIFVGFLLLRLLGGFIIETLSEFYHYCMSLIAALSRGEAVDTFGEIFNQMVVAVFKTAGPLLLGSLLAATVATFAQTRLLVSSELLKPKFSRINPLEGFKRLFSLKSVVEALKGIIKIIVLLYVIYDAIMDTAGEFGKYIYVDVSAAAAHIFDVTFAMVMKIAVAFTALAALDFMYQWWDYERQLKMSKQEIKEEYKQTEGDPQIKSKIKENQRRMAQQRMMQQVPQADVVVRNPDHFAVALRYDSKRDRAPVVLAKGMDALALRIVKVAQEHNIPAIENVPLARALYAEAELNHEIPPAFYGEVAEVLVYIYRLENRELTK
ncbi:MAG: flagellar biosynthesis protein FlhB [Oscillospiraceae bacterium]|nr:flagellar biosynthesis protein FlhB [Oscillospiraceae bacterium]